MLLICSTCCYLFEGNGSHWKSSMKYEIRLLRLHVISSVFVTTDVISRKKYDFNFDISEKIFSNYGISNSNLSTAYQKLWRHIDTYTSQHKDYNIIVYIQSYQSDRRAFSLTVILYQILEENPWLIITLFAQEINSILSLCLRFQWGMSCLKLIRPYNYKTGGEEMRCTILLLKLLSCRL